VAQLKEPVGFVIAVDDPRATDVRNLLQAHLDFSRGVTPAEYSCALDVEDLADPAVTFFGARRRGELLAIGALRRLDDAHAELKSMHTRHSARGQGVGKAMVDQLLKVAQQQGYRRVSLETGTTDDFLPARRLYLNAGFQPCGPFGNYQASPHNTFTTIYLD
jgi:putative acetyltransferase